MRHLGLLFGATPFDFWSRGQICGQLAGQPTGDDFDGLPLKGGREVLVPLSLPGALRFAQVLIAWRLSLSLWPL